MTIEVANRSISRGNNNGAQRITLPLTWSKIHEYPSKVSMMIGVDMIVMAIDDETAIKAAEALAAAGLFTSLEKEDSRMGVVA